MVSPHIEKEYKMMIDESEYNFLINKYEVKPFLQINYYYSSNNPNVALRIRSIENNFIFTLKEKIKDYHNEYEFTIQDNNLDDQRIKELLIKFNINSPQYLGKLETYRTLIKLKKGEICIDKNLYLNKIDYELEYELYDYNNKDDEFELFLKDNSLSFKESSQSKYGRFKASL